MNFHDDMPSSLIGNFKDHFVLLFDLTSIPDVSENIPQKYLKSYSDFYNTL